MAVLNLTALENHLGSFENSQCPGQEIRLTVWETHNQDFNVPQVIQMDSQG